MPACARAHPLGGELAGEAPQIDACVPAPAQADSGSARASVNNWLTGARCASRSRARAAAACAARGPAASLGLVQRQLGLALQPGQRRAQLVRRVADETSLAADALVHLGQQRVDRLGQRMHLARRRFEDSAGRVVGRAPPPPGRMRRQRRRRPARMPAHTIIDISAITTDSGSAVSNQDAARAAARGWRGCAPPAPAWSAACRPRRRRIQRRARARPAAAFAIAPS